MIRVFAMLYMFMMICPTFHAQAQDRWRFEILPGAAFATSSPSGTTLKTGAGFEASVSYRLQSHLYGYFGWDWHKFGSDASFSESNADFEETGYAFGFRFEHPIAGLSRPLLHLRAGATYNHIEVEDATGNITLDSGHGIGFEAGAGAAFPIGKSWRLTPGLRFRSTSRDFTVNNAVVPAKLQYIAVECGISRSF